MTMPREYRSEEEAEREAERRAWLREHPVEPDPYDERLPGGRLYPWDEEELRRLEP
jgi:hypothetical protein